MSKRMGCSLEAGNDPLEAARKQEPQSYNWEELNLAQMNLEAHSFKNLQMRTQPVNSLNVILRVENPFG